MLQLNDRSALAAESSGLWASSPWWPLVRAYDSLGTVQPIVFGYLAEASAGACDLIKSVADELAPRYAALYLLESVEAAVGIATDRLREEIGAAVFKLQSAGAGDPRPHPLLLPWQPSSRRQEAPTAGTLAQPSRARTLPRPPAGPLLPPPPAPVEGGPAAVARTPAGRARQRDEPLRLPIRAGQAPVSTSSDDVKKKAWREIRAIWTVRALLC